MSKEYDPKMHSAEHILNQVMVRKFDCGRCFSAHINKKKSKCDYHFPRELKTDEVRQIEKDVNEQISKDMPVLIEQMSIEDAKELFNIERVPDKDTLDSLRVVRMGDFDACPCIGSPCRFYSFNWTV